MSVNIASKYVEVFKFKETGVVALCQEVAEFVKEEHGYNIDLHSARFVEDANTYAVVFDRVTEP